MLISCLNGINNARDSFQIGHNENTHDISPRTTELIAKLFLPGTAFSIISQSPQFLSSDSGGPSPNKYCDQFKSKLNSHR